MVTFGKCRSSIGWVVIEVEIGFSCHSLYDFPIRIPAPMKLRQTASTHRNFADFV